MDSINPTFEHSLTSIAIGLRLQHIRFNTARWAYTIDDYDTLLALPPIVDIFVCLSSPFDLTKQSRCLFQQLGGPRI